MKPPSRLVPALVALVAAVLTFLLLGSGAQADAGTCAPVLQFDLLFGGEGTAVEDSSYDRTVSAVNQCAAVHNARLAASLFLLALAAAALAVVWVRSGQGNGRDGGRVGWVAPSSVAAGRDQGADDADGGSSGDARGPGGGEPGAPNGR
ncbi:hypothetical protein [Streptomyces albidoflavus]|uniref:hypothetical protein n=1 Tax=Streptomyces albidoflavus TaxID=1886 RepID=UPI0033DCF048